MRVPMGWLRDFVDLPESAKDVAERLTFAGIEVEGIETAGCRCEGVVVGEVRTGAHHPNAERLSVCTVFDGQRDWPVVCGAPNVRPGGKYPFAPIGAKLADGTVIRRARLRGVESEGMLCAEDELGLSDDHSKLLELPDDLPAGRSLLEVLGPAETVLDLEITPNRPDCLSVLGIARELSVIFRRPLRRPSFDLPPLTVEATPPLVEVRAPDRCPRYTARILRGVRVAPSPFWMQHRLRCAGIRPINNLVDITNYVLIELGHPLHAFDLARLRGGRILVRVAEAGERIRTLDGIERVLDGETLVIADAEGPVAVAGIMGGQGSEITSETTDVLLESAAFQKAGVRLAARRLGLASESSHRFARGVDPEGVDRASRRAAALMLELGGGRLGGFADVYSQRPSPATIRCRPSRMASLIGMPVSTPRALEIFQGLEMRVEPLDADTIEVTPPSFRGDIREEVDLAEEYARLEGLDRIPAPAPSARVVETADDAPLRVLAKARRQWIALGLTEALNYSLLAPALLRIFGMDGPDVIRLPNALSEEYSALRPSLLPQLIATLGHNRFHQVQEGAVFEVGRVFWRETSGVYREETRMAVSLMGAAGRPLLDRRRAPSAEECWRWLKGLLERWFAAIGVTAWGVNEAPHPAFQAGQSFRIEVAGEPAGVAGIVRREIASEWRIYEPMAAAELTPAICLRHRRTAAAPTPPPAFPATRRDVALVVDSTVRNEEILRVIQQAAPPELESVELFDIFTGAGIPQGRKSMAYSLVYRSPERTLTDEDVERFHGAVVAALVRDLNAEIRAG